MSHIPLLFAQNYPAAADGYSSLVTFATETAFGLTAATNKLVGTTQSNLGRFLVTDVWWADNTANNAGFTLSLGVTGTAYTDICSATVVATPGGTRNWGRLTLVATASVNGPTVAPSTQIYCRCSASTNTGSVQIYVCGFYLGARLPP